MTPLFRLVTPSPRRRPASSRTTRRPARDSTDATAQPITPPPTTATSTSASTPLLYGSCGITAAWLAALPARPPSSATSLASRHSSDFDRGSPDRGHFDGWQRCRRGSAILEEALQSEEALLVHLIARDGERERERHRQHGEEHKGGQL